jgi:hypothetical protein
MHHLMLVTLELPDDATPSDARLQAHNMLCEDPSFAGEGGRFGAPMCDWFVIGGRWSGLLKKALLGEPYRAAFERDFPEMAKDWYTSDLIEKNRRRLNRFWRKFGGTGDHPIVRSGYDNHGHDDDAMLVDDALFRHFLAQYRGESTQVEGDSGTFADLDDEPVAESFIGRKWLVVVDYHN